MSFLAFLSLCLRLAVVLAGLSLANPEEFIGAVAIILNVLCIDRLACAQHKEGELDSHTLAVAALLARPLSLARSMGDPAGDRLPEAIAGAFWCAVCLVVTAMCKKKGGSAWLPAILNAECGLGVMLTYAPFEPLWMYSCRVVALACLSTLLYLDPPCRDSPIWGGRGFLVCFGPVMFADWWMACCFSLASLACVHWREIAWLLGRAQGPQTHGRAEGPQTHGRAQGPQTHELLSVI